MFGRRSRWENPRLCPDSPGPSGFIFALSLGMTFRASCHPETLSIGDTCLMELKRDGRQADGRRQSFLGVQAFDTATNSSSRASSRVRLVIFFIWANRLNGL